MSLEKSFMMLVSFTGCWGLQRCLIAYKALTDQQSHSTGPLRQSHPMACQSSFLAKIHMWAKCLEKIWSLQWSRQSRWGIPRTSWRVPIISSSNVELDYPQRKLCQPSFILKIKLCYKPPKKNKQMGIKNQSRNSFTIKSESVDEMPCIKSSVESGFS